MRQSSWPPANEDDTPDRQAVQVANGPGPPFSAIAETIGSISGTANNVCGHYG